MISINLIKDYVRPDVTTITGKITDFQTGPPIFVGKTAHVYLVKKPDCPDLIYHIRDEPMRQELIVRYQETNCSVWTMTKGPEQDLVKVLQSVWAQMQEQEARLR
jgi:hypothetical protein